MSDQNKVITTSSIEDFYKKIGFPMPVENTIDRNLFDENELSRFEDYFVSLCVDLTLYNLLFGSDKSVDVLNEFNNFIFSRIQNNFIEKICLKIACLLDPAESGKDGGNKNLSLKRFVAMAKNKDLTKAYEELHKSYRSTGINIWRNKILAHSDLDTAMGNYKFKLSFEASDLESLIQRIQDIMDLIHDPATSTDTEITLPFGLDGNSFISRLDQLNRKKS